MSEAREALELARKEGDTDTLYSALELVLYEAERIEREANQETANPRHHHAEVIATQKRIDADRIQSAVVESLSDR